MPKNARRPLIVAAALLGMFTASTGTAHAYGHAVIETDGPHVHTGSDHRPTWRITGTAKTTPVFDWTFWN